MFYSEDRKVKQVLSEGGDWYQWESRGYKEWV
jgi:hypothetical protein